jgi:hypothetical protein
MAEISFVMFDAFLKKCITNPSEYKPPSGLEKYVQKRNIKFSDSYTEKQAEWLDMRARYYGIFDPINNDHSCFQSDCKISNNIVNFDDNCFGCVESGKIHICNSTNDCNYKFVNNNEMIICYFSGYEISSIYKAENDFYSKEKGLKLDDEEDNNNINNDVSITNNIEAEESTQSKPNMKKFSQINIRIKRDKNEMEVRDIGTKINSIVSDLLYNDKERNRIDSARKKELNLLCRKSIDKYYRQFKKKKTRPNYWNVIGIIQQQSIKKQRLITIPYDHDRVKFYTDIIHILWVIIHQSEFYREKKTKLNARQHVLGALYILNSPTKNEDIGYSINCDDYLYRYLPSQNDLKEWSNGKYDKSDITDGRNNIKAAIASFSNSEKELYFELILKIRNHFAPKFHFSSEYIPFYGLFSTDSQINCNNI